MSAAQRGPAARGGAQAVVAAPLRYRRFWLAGGFAFVSLTLAFSLLPQPGIPPLAFSDKVLHFATFVFLTVWFLGLVEPALAWRVLAALAAYGLLIEVLQHFTADRSSEALDFTADLLGIGVGWALARAGLRRWCWQVEALLVAARNGHGRR